MVTVAKLTRIRGITPKPACKPAPWLPCNWKVIVDVQGSGKIYADFWKPGILTQKRSEAITNRAFEALAADYFYETEPADLPDFSPKFCYSGTFSNDRLALACVTLMQLNITARLAIVVTERGRECSFVVGANQPAVHVLRQFFRHVEQVDPETYERVLNGGHHNPRELRKFTFPDIAGVGKPLPLPVSPPSFGGGSVVLGDYLNQYTKKPAGPAGIPFELLNRHVVVAGTNGSGKTNTVMKIIHEVHDRVESVLVFDIKREYRSLAKTLNADVYGFSNEANLFTHNILKPECEPERWVKEFAHIFAQVISKHMPATGTGDVIAEELDKLYAERGIYDGGTDSPHIGDLLEALEKRNSSGSRERNWLASGLRVLRNLRIGTTKDAFFVRDGVSLNRLLEGVVVLELEGIGNPAVRDLLVSVILQKIRHVREGKDENVAKHLVVVEEAQHVLAKGNEATSVLTDTCREIRAFGVGLVFVTQVPSEFSKDAIANVNTVMVHKLVHPEDKRFAANLLGLPEEARDFIERLPVGQGFVRSNGLMLVQVHEVPRPKVWDNELSKTVPNRQDVATNVAHRKSVENKVARLSPLAKDALLAIARADAVTPSGLRALLHRSQGSVNGALSRLRSAGLVAYVTALAPNGRPPSIYFLMPEGLEAFRQETGTYPDRRGTEHDHKQLVDAAVAALGLTRLHHERFDILYEAEGEQRAIEVETGANNDDQLDANLAKMLELQGDVQFVAADDRAFNRVLQTCARWSYTNKKPLTLRVAFPAELPEWTQYTFRTEEPSTP